MYATRTLEYLEKVQSTSESWKKYVRIRACDVKAHILRLRSFANKNKSRVADIINGDADKIQARLDAVLNRFV